MKHVVWWLKVQVLTQTRGRRKPTPSVSPTRCRGNSGAAGSARSCGRSARCRSAASRAGWAGRPASSPLPPHLQRLETGVRPRPAPRYSSPSALTPHLSLGIPAPGVPLWSSARAQCRRSRRRCVFSAWHHQRSALGDRQTFTCSQALLSPEGVGLLGLSLHTELNKAVGEELNV